MSKRETRVYIRWFPREHDIIPEAHLKYAVAPSRGTPVVWRFECEVFTGISLSFGNVKGAL
jgi:hypothetical protein